MTHKEHAERVAADLWKANTATHAERVAIIESSLKAQREKAWADAWAEVGPFLIGMGKKQVDGIFAALRKAILNAEVEAGTSTNHGHTAP